MSIWNTFDPSLVTQVFEEPKKGVQETIAEKVWKAAATEGRRKRRNLSMGGTDTNFFTAKRDSLNALDS